MDLRLVVEDMFPGENVSPAFESYDLMASHWRGSRAVPTLKEIEDYEAAMPIVVPEKSTEEKLEALSLKVQALEEKPQ